MSEISRFATRIGIIHEGRLIKEVDTSQLDRLCRKRLLVNARDTPAAHSLLIQSGYTLSLTKEGILELPDEEAVNNPEIIANLMVNSGCPPTLLQVEEEDLESYFLRTIGINEVVK